MTTAVLSAKVDDGMFPDENFIVATDADGQNVTFIVTSRLVRKRPNGDGVEVRVMKEADGFAIVRVPGEVFGASTLLRVKKSELAPIS